MPVIASPQEHQEWKEKIRQQKESGQTIVAWCQQSGISPHRFKYWKKRLTPQPTLSRSSFKELVSPSSKETGITIECRGFSIHLRQDFNPATLTKCLQALKSLC